MVLRQSLMGELSAQNAPDLSATLRGFVGIDEAGRGCLAGPVVAAAALFAPDFDFLAVLPGLDDSKKLSAKNREKLLPAIQEHAVAWSLGVSWPAEIDEINILNATFRAMSRAASRLVLPFPLPSLAVDGNHAIRPDAWNAVTTIPMPEQTPVIDGDALVPQIAAASIIAKTFRDALMRTFDKRYPGYGFAAHKGYGAKAHRAAIQELGPCPMHRKTFRGVREEEKHLTLF